MPTIETAALLAAVAAVVPPKERVIVSVSVDRDVTRISSSPIWSTWPARMNFPASLATAHVVVVVLAMAYARRVEFGASESSSHSYLVLKTFGSPMLLSPMYFTSGVSSGDTLLIRSSIHRT